MSINSRKTVEKSIPAALMATIMACSSTPEQGELVPATDQICGQTLYNPGACEEPIPLKMAPEVERFLCETANAIRNPENTYAISDDEGQPSDLFHKRFPEVTPAAGVKDKVYQCGEDPETGSAECAVMSVKGLEDTIYALIIDNTGKSITVEDGLAKLSSSTDPLTQLTVGMIDGIAPVANDWNAPCEKKEGEKTCSKPWPPEECEKPFIDFVDKVRSSIHAIVAQHGRKKTDFAQRRRPR